MRATARRQGAFLPHRQRARPVGVAPGPTDTPLLRDDPNIDAYAETLPLGRVIRPDEIAAAVVFALLEDTTLTAQVISPNGGAVP